MRRRIRALRGFDTSHEWGLLRYHMAGRGWRWHRIQFEHGPRPLRDLRPRCWQSRANWPHSWPRIHRNHQRLAQRNPGQASRLFLTRLLKPRSCGGVYRLCHCDHAQWHAEQQCTVPRDQVTFQGSTRSTPQSRKSATLRVANIALRTWAMAAICASA